MTLADFLLYAVCALFWAVVIAAVVTRLWNAVLDFAGDQHRSDR